MVGGGRTQFICERGQSTVEGKLAGMFSSHWSDLITAFVNKNFFIPARSWAKLFPTWTVIETRSTWKTLAKFPWWFFALIHTRPWKFSCLPLNVMNVLCALPMGTSWTSSHIQKCNISYWGLMGDQPHSFPYQWCMFHDGGLYSVRSWDSFPNNIIFVFFVF